MSESLFPLFLADAIVKPLRVLCEEGGGDIQTGPFGSQLHASDYVKEGIPSIMPKNIGDNRVSTEDIAYITEEDAQRLARYRVRPGDIVYSRRGDVEKRALIREAEDGWLCGTGCLRVRPGEGGLDSVFLSHYLAHPAVRNWVVQHAIGATMPNLNTTILGDLPVVMYPQPTQKRIAHILGTLDDKIELNRRMNRTLEAIAQAIFKSWFVDFDPVHAKAEGREPVSMDPETAALFPDTFHDSPLGKIPKGWDVGNLRTIATRRHQTIKPEQIEDGTPYVALDDIPRRSIALDSWKAAEGIASTKSCFLEGDVLFGKLRPYFHKVVIAPTDGICSTDIIVVTPLEDLWLAYVLMICSSAEFIAYNSAVMTGTKMPRTNWKDMSSYELPIPPREIAADYQAVTQPLIDQLLCGIHEVPRLTEVRDALLPRLISRELKGGA